MSLHSVSFCGVFFIHTCFSSLFGQFTISPNTTVIISENTVTSLDCSMSNQGTMENRGTIYISGDWDNPGVYEPGSGNVVLNGSIQHVDQQQQRFFNLEAAADEVYVESDMYIEGVLLLSSGTVTPNPEAVILIRQNADIENSSGSAYVNGMLYHEGEGEKFFPVGKDGHYRPVRLLNIQGNDPVTGLETFNLNPSPVCGPQIVMVSEDVYWQLELLSGTYEGSVVELDISDPVSDMSGDLVVVQADSLGNMFTSIGNAGGDNILIVSELPLIKRIFSIGEYDDSVIEIMNIITPNGDGVNDVLYISNLETYPENEVIVVNMAGIRVFSATNYDNTWDAMIDNKYLPAGDYICIVKIPGQDQEYKQMVTILK